MAPSLFIPHGSPLLALAEDATTQFFREWGASQPRPTAVVVVSAHWQTPGLRVTHWASHPVIHDFYGFPDELYQLDYPAPGHPELARRIQQAVEAWDGAPSLGPVTLDGERGLDHGVWVPLRHMYPQADVPVVQVSLPFSWGPERLYLLGRALDGLREEGVLVLGSGFATHNLQTAVPQTHAETPTWARVFEEWLRANVLAWNTDELFEFWVNAPHGAQAHPTAEHLAPLFVAMGAAHSRPTSRVVHEGFSMGTFSLLSLAFGE
ncbi:MAG: dioxygenase [Deltaproteobacteria bacterium]|nr:dioxygenase [Deltaproteobacteria bacterium]